MRTATTTFAELGLVALGGALGTLGRYGLTLLVGDVAEFPLGVLLVNVSGAFGLGMLLELLALRGGDTGMHRGMRLLFGTGVFGGFTTYSLLATDVAVMLQQGQLVVGAMYAGVTLVVGGLASWFGILIAKRLHGPRASGAPSSGTTSSGTTSREIGNPS